MWRWLLPLATLAALTVSGCASTSSSRAPRGKILFIRADRTGGALYSVNADGSGLHEIAAGIRRVGEDADGDCEEDRTYEPLCFAVGDARWSADGRRVVFTRPYAGLFVADADGSSQRRLVTGYAVDPDWSPDGRQVVFEWDTKSGRYLYIASLTGGVRRLPNAPFGAEKPRWSRDGRTIAFVAHESQIWVMRPDGGGKRVIARAPIILDPPDWSADSQWIAYRASAGNLADVYLVRPNGSSRTKLTRSGGVEFGPQWAPVGDGIGYIADISCGGVLDEGGRCVSTQVLIHRTRDSPSETIDDDPSASHFDLSWSPDGTRIALDRDATGIYVKRLDRPGLTLVVRNARLLHWATK